MICRDENLSEKSQRFIIAINNFLYENPNRTHDIEECTYPIEQLKDYLNQIIKTNQDKDDILGLLTEMLPPEVLKPKGSQIISPAMQIIKEVEKGSICKMIQKLKKNGSGDEAVIAIIKDLMSDAGKDVLLKSKDMFVELAQLTSAYSEYHGSRTVTLSKNGQIIISKGTTGTTDVDSNVAENLSKLRATLLDHIEKEKNTNIQTVLVLLFKQLNSLNPENCNQENGVLFAHVLETIFAMLNKVGAFQFKEIYQDNDKSLLAESHSFKEKILKLKQKDHEHHTNEYMGKIHGVLHPIDHNENILHE